MAALSIVNVYPIGVSNSLAHDGSVTAVVTGGHIPYSASVDGSTYYPETTTVNNLGSGNYTLYIKDNNGQVVTAPFTVPTYPQIIGLSTTNETSISTHDGTLTFSVMGGTSPYYYSIDAINFFPVDQPTFVRDIARGTYALNVYDSQYQPVKISTDFTILQFAAQFGCTDPGAINYDPNAQVNNGSCIYANPEDAETLNNLYEAPDCFRLITQAGLIYDIDEPKDWDKIEIVLSRDPKYNGVNYEFTEGDIKLRFDDPAGRQLLLSEFNSYGNDAITRFQFGYDMYGQFIADLDAYIDYNSYEVQENYIVVGVKRKTFNDLIETRADSVVNVNNPLTISLHSKLIQKRTVVNQANKTGTQAILPVNPFNYGIMGQSPWIGYCTFLDFSTASLNDLCQDAPLTGVYAEDPTQVSEYIFKTDGGGDFTFEISFQVALHVKLEQPTIALGGSPRNGYWSYFWYLAVNDDSHKYGLSGGLEGFTKSRFNDITATCSITKTLNLQVNDRVYLYGQYICEDRGSKKDVVASMDIIYSNINIVGNTIAVPTPTSCSLAFETFQYLLDYSTKFNAKLKSNLLGRIDLGYASDGCAALLAYTNGYQVRGFDQTVRPMQLSYSDALAGLHALYYIGQGYELDSYGNYLVRIEKAEYFYQDANILTIDSVSDYKEDIDTTIIYNQLEFGYQKYTQNLPSSPYTLDEFNTDHKLDTPIQSIKNALTQVCKQITSGYSFELTRRQQFADAPVDSWTYDEDVFIASCVRTGSGYKPERLENFTASGILSPETAYNLRLTPTRMLDRWSRFVKSGLAYKKPSDVLVNNYVAKNGDLISKYNGSDGCDSNSTFREGDNRYLGDFANTPLFMPVRISFTKRISWDLLRMFRRCFQGQDTTGKNNGYISVVDCSGDIQQGYLIELRYNPESELASFVLQKKFVNLTVPFDCSVYSPDTFAQFEATTGLPAEIEQCIFSNFA